MVLALVLFCMSLLSVAGSAQTTRAATPALALESLTGRDSFDRYCSACHGADGRGTGPVASALKTRPADLTTLARAQRRVVPATADRLVRGRDGQATPCTWNQRHASVGEHVSRPRAVRRASESPPDESRGLCRSRSQRRDRDVFTRCSGSGPVTGAPLFPTYCASCHGETPGNRPLSTQLTRSGAGPDERYLIALQRRSVPGRTALRQSHRGPWTRCSWRPNHAGLG